MRKKLINQEMLRWMRDELANHEVLKCKDSCRILKAVRRKPLLYSAIKRLLNLKPARLNRLLKMLREGMWVITRVRPVTVKFYQVFKDPRKNGDGIAIPHPDTPTRKCKILVEYSLSKRGAAVLRAHAK